MEWGYYTFPGLLIGVTFTLYTWQEPKMKGLESGRNVLIGRKVKALLGTASEHVESTLFEYLLTAFENDKDLLMPIRQFRPYKRISILLSFAMLVATICAVLHSKLNQVIVIERPNTTLNDAFTIFLIALCVLPAKLVYDEFRYMKRIIGRFDHHT